jgi:peptide deformylase
MVHDIVIYPDRRLKLVSKKIEQFDETLHALLDDMYETMIAKNGVGLAAIQIGVAKRVLIINVPIDTEDEEIETQPKENTLEIINPVITYRSEEMIKFQEGCLSIPSIYEDIERHAMVTIEYQDRFGKQQVIEDDEFLAIALQHEIDHLDGILFIEKL